MDVWFTSDLHLGHEFVARLRGMDVATHDEVVLEGIRKLPAGDRLWVLGDISRGSSENERRALDLLAEHGGHLEMHLVPGNHDSCHPIHRSSHRRQEVFLEVFASVQAFQKLRWRGRDVFLCHFPRPGMDHEGMASRHDEVRLDVDLLVHGHLHSPQPITGWGLVDVGLDAWGMSPVRQFAVEKALFDHAGHLSPGDTWPGSAGPGR